MDIKISDTGVPRGVTDIANALPNSASVKENSSITIVFSGDEFTSLLS